MPKLLVFVPCRAVLYDDSKNISPISIFTEVRIPRSVEGIPAEAHAAMQWHVLTIWGRLPEDEGRRYEEDVMLIGPDGTMTSHTKIQFCMEQPLQRNTSNVFGFPIGQTGPYELVLKLKDLGTPEVFLQEHSFPMRVIHGEASG